MNEVRSAAAAFRQAILACPDTGLISLRDFPHGSCGDASPLLGQFLRDQGFGVWEYVAGERGSDQHTHAWLEQGGWLLDITADQFPGVRESVVLTQDRSWHAQFRQTERRAASIDMWDEHTTRDLTEAYEMIVAEYERRR
ncbi:hypothetical protein [Streptomyces sp. NPDC050548]|uniref:hypothetical protein n=1 Tax=Streptomyces sp. NPDC050548 TaxID=3365629 RepID=UPI0037B1B80E